MTQTQKKNIKIFQLVIPAFLLNNKLENHTIYSISFQLIRHYNDSKIFIQV